MILKNAESLNLWWNYSLLSAYMKNKKAFVTEEDTQEP